MLSGAHIARWQQRRPLCTVAGDLVHVYRGIFTGMWTENGGCDLPAEDAANSQTQAQQRMTHNMWIYNSMIQTDVEQLLALRIAADA